MAMTRSTLERVSSSLITVTFSSETVTVSIFTRESIWLGSISGTTITLSRFAFLPTLTVIFCGVATAVKPLGKFSMVRGTSMVPYTGIG